MKIDRLAIILEALAEVGTEVSRQTRYANNTGTCIWCRTGPLVMVPDDPGRPWFCQAKGSEELSEKLTPLVEERLEAAKTAPVTLGAGPGAKTLDAARSALLHAGEALYAQGQDASLDRVRAIFTTIMRGQFKSLDPIVEQRIASASWDQIERWSERVHQMPRAIMVVV